MSNNVLILFSGGIDSTSCIHYYKKLNYSVNGLFIDYGQPAAYQESHAVDKLSKYLEIDTQKITINIKPNIKNGFIQGRNLLLFAISLSNNPFSKGIISLGIHSGSIYSDCTLKFIELNQKMLDLYTNGNINIDCPFLKINKAEVCDYFLKTGIPLEYTYSCESGNEIPCGVCQTCKDLKDIFQ